MTTTLQQLDRAKRLFEAAKQQAENDLQGVQDAEKSVRMALREGNDRMLANAEARLAKASELYEVSARVMRSRAEALADIQSEYSASRARESAEKAELQLSAAERQAAQDIEALEAAAVELNKAIHRAEISVAAVGKALGVVSPGSFLHAQEIPHALSVWGASAIALQIPGKLANNLSLKDIYERALRAARPKGVAA
jgi:chromosome segregation ATPase